MGISKMPVSGGWPGIQKAEIKMAKGNSDEFDIGSVVMRMAFSLAMVFLTFNPTGHSYYHWLQRT